MIESIHRNEADLKKSLRLKIQAIFELAIWEHWLQHCTEIAGQQSPDVAESTGHFVAIEVIEHLQ